MEIILFIIIIVLFVYFNNKINNIAILSDKQTKVIVEFLISKLQEKDIFKNDEVDHLYQEINQKIKEEVKVNEYK
ncbi:MAG: hypothetical protein IPN70_01545 [Candidatus Moraniibacteriota bacterium]|nr:MAG: hypothetical protein IPN70_01545 [Candidatus Moranbacteria bacterium]